MDFTDVISARKSVRGYTDKPVEEEKLLKVPEAARLGKQTMLQVYSC